MEPVATALLSYPAENQASQGKDQAHWKRQLQLTFESFGRSAKKAGKELLLNMADTQHLKAQTNAQGEPDYGWIAVSVLCMFLFALVVILLLGFVVQLLWRFSIAPMIPKKIEFTYLQSVGLVIFVRSLFW